MKFVLLILTIIVAGQLTIFAQAAETPLFRAVVEKKLRETYHTDLSKVCPLDSDPAAARVFADYGAIFVSNNGGDLPTRCIFENEAAVQAFQAYLKPDVVTIGGVPVTLQKAAMAAFLAARTEASKKGVTISPLGGWVASTRSYAKTLELWQSRFTPALKYWVAKGKIKPEDAASAQKASIATQVAMVLAWEEKGLYFSKDLSKSILYSAAVPGASQHIFMLALDVEQFGDKRVRQILAEHGWFQTVKSDLPHFTYIGVAEKDLPSLGLTPVDISGQKFWIPKT